MSEIEPAWLQDPSDPSLMRWWNGSSWTQMSISLDDAHIGPGAFTRKASSAPAPDFQRAQSTATAEVPSSWKPTKLFWVAGSVVALLAIVEVAAGGFANLFAFLGLVGIITGIYAAVSKRPSWANFPSGPRIRGIAIAASAVLFIVGATLMPPSQTDEPLENASNEDGNSLVQSLTGNVVSTRSPVSPTTVASASPTPSPTPVIDLAEYSGSTAATAIAELDSKGVLVVARTADGQTAPTDLTGWTIVSQTPASGAGLYDNSTVTFVVAPPVIVEPAAPAPAAPAAPAAPVTPGGGATALCNDGTYSFAAHHQGACSHHGGVSVFYK